nr:hypothetical protein BaRGS_030591 [Batillaria attramentaria]
MSIATYRCIICAKAFVALDDLRLHVKQICRPGITQPALGDRMAFNKAQATEAGLETSTVFQCMRCYELCISEQGIREHKLVCSKASKQKPKSKARPRTPKPKPPKSEDETATEAKVMELLSKCLGEHRKELEASTTDGVEVKPKKKSPKKKPTGETTTKVPESAEAVSDKNSKQEIPGVAAETDGKEGEKPKPKRKYYPKKKKEPEADGSSKAEGNQEPSPSKDGAEKKQAKKKKEKEPSGPPLPRYKELSGSGGRSFFKCLNCNQTLCSIENFMEHWLECIVKKPLPAKKRPVEFSRRSVLIQHLAGKHVHPYTKRKLGDTSSFFCHLCQKVFPHYTAYMRHVMCHAQAIEKKMQEMTSVDFNPGHSRRIARQRGVPGQNNRKHGRTSPKGALSVHGVEVVKRGRGRPRKDSESAGPPKPEVKPSPVTDRRSSGRAAQKQALSKIYISSLGIPNMVEEVKENKKRRLAPDEKDTDGALKSKRARQKDVEKTEAALDEDGQESFESAFNDDTEEEADNETEDATWKPSSQSDTGTEDTAVPTASADQETAPLTDGQEKANGVEDPSRQERNERTRKAFKEQVNVAPFTWEMEESEKNASVAEEYEAAKTSTQKPAPVKSASDQKWLIDCQVAHVARKGMAKQCYPFAFSRARNKTQKN